jgi:hypothetical protein
MRCLYCRSYPDDTTARQLNVPLLMETLQQVRTEAAKPPSESRWSQGAFEKCGTTRCFGGWAIVLTGHEIYPSPHRYAVNGGTGAWAEDLLGITHREAEHLFFCTTSPSTSVAKIEEIVSWILERRGLSPVLPVLPTLSEETSRV